MPPDAETDPPTPPRDIRAEGIEAARRGLLDIASVLLEARGPEALSVRRVVAQAGCSTTVIYTLFGSKEGIVNGLHLEGFRRLRRALNAVDEPDALGRLRLLNRAYRRVALENPTYYAVMFECPVPGYRPDDLHRREA